MVDEFQDTCRTQNALLGKLVDRDRNLMVVGDPQQCVFSWRSADPRLLLEFQLRTRTRVSLCSTRITAPP
jgi:DNA helicase-2/ATP-dependent DNA helicase PcrA